MKPRTSPCSPKSRKPCVGRSALRGRSGDLTRTHPLPPDRVVAGLTFLGELSREEVREHMARAGVFVSPARYEPFGLAILEAASADCALVLADIPSLRELWDGAALFVDPRDASDVAGALDRVCQDATLRRKLAEAARRRARRYSVEATARSYFELYQALLAPRADALPDRAPMVPA